MGHTRSIDLVRELIGKRCICGRSKRPRATFCLTCYSRLPDLLQGNLYKRIGQGYERAYHAAVDWLRSNSGRSVRLAKAPARADPASIMFPDSGDED